MLWFCTPIDRHLAAAAAVGAADPPAGTNELIFTPKFLAKAKDSASTQQPRTSLVVGSLAPSCDALRSHLSQSSTCSTVSADGPARYLSTSSVSSLASLTAAAGGGRDCARMPGLLDRGCGGPAAALGPMAQFAVDTVHSSDRHTIHAGSMQAAATAAAVASALYSDSRVASGGVCSGSNLAVVNSGQQLLAEQPRSSFEQQQQQQHAYSLEAAAKGTAAGQRHNRQAWLQQWQGAGRPHPPALDEGSAGAAGGAYLPSFWPLQDNGAPATRVLSAAAAYAGLQPTSASFVASAQQGMQLPFSNGFADGCPSVLPVHDRSALGSFIHAAACQGPDLGPAGDSMGLPSLTSAFARNNECFSTYSNLMDGQKNPSMHLANPSTSGRLAHLSAAANSLADAVAAADCSASLFASGAFASGAFVTGGWASGTAQPQLQPQLQAMPQHHAGMPSGSNLQLTAGAMYVATGGMWDGVEDLAEASKQGLLLQCETDWPAACDDSGYFDLAYKSGSSLDKDSPQDLTAGSSSCSNKTSGCAAADSRHALASSQAALVRQQQGQLLAMQEQRKRQLEVQQLAAAANPSSFLAAPGSIAAGQQWPPPRQPQQQPLSGSLFPGAADLSGPQAVCEARDSAITLDVPTTAQDVSVVAVHIDSIRSMSGAAMAIVPQPGGQLAFTLLGTPSQISMAVGFIQVLLQKAEPR